MIKPTDKRYTVTLPAELLAEIEDYRREIGAVTMSEVVRDLLRSALRAAKRARDRR